MATDATMSRQVRELASAFTKFAARKGWQDQDYWLYYSLNPDWGRVHFVFVSKGFDEGDNYQHYKEVWDFLKEVLPDDPEILNALNLVVMGKKKLDQGGINRIGPEYEPIPDIKSFKEYWTMYGRR